MARLVPSILEESEFYSSKNGYLFWLWVHISNPWTSARTIIHGIPYTITSDQGTSFIEKEVWEWTYDHGIHQLYYMPLHPEAASLLELWNGLLKAQLKHQFKRNTLHRWVTIIQKVAHAVKQRLFTGNRRVHSCPPSVACGSKVNSVCRAFTMVFGAILYVCHPVVSWRAGNLLVLFSDFLLHWLNQIHTGTTLD